MANAWLSPTTVLAWARADGDISLTDVALVSAVDGAAGVVERLVDRADFTSPDTVPGDVMLGAIMLAWRFYQRRNSPLGVSGYQDYGTAPLLRHDPDIAKLLGIGPDGPFVFAAAGIASTDVLPAWAASTDYAVGDRVSLLGGVELLATVAGTSGTAEPVPPAVIGGTVVDGTVTWVRVS